MYEFERNLWSTWQELEQFQGDMHRLFTGGDGIAMNAWYGEEGALLTAQLPGVDKDALDISVRGDEVTLRGQRTSAAVAKDAKVHRQEAQPGKFTRSVQLPFKVDASAVVAQLENGLLHLTLPRAAEDRPQRIAIKAS
jgi:HSP20 family protein